MIVMAALMMQVDSQAPAVFGQGLGPCRDVYERANSNPYDLARLQIWQLGFWSALNVANHATVGVRAQRGGTVTINIEVEHECERSSQDTVFETERRVYDRFKVAGL